MGSGYRVFTAGEVLTASNVQNYLQDQAVMVFGGTAARSSAIGTANFEEGMLTYLTDVDKLQVYTGAAFADVYPPTASSQGLTLISTTSFSAVASQSINDVFSATYSKYKMICNISFSTSLNLSLRWRVGGSDNSNSNYNTQRINGNGTSVIASRPDASGSSARISGQSFPSGTEEIINLEIKNPFQTQKTIFWSESGINGQDIEILTGAFTATTSFTGLTLLASTGSITGSVSVYGYNV
jgi:hypothetical protein